MNYLIIGNSAAGIFAAEAIRTKDTEGKITILTDESYQAYGRCLISYYLSKSVAEESMYLRSGDFYRRHRLELVTDCKVTSLNCQLKKVHAGNGRTFSYDKLLIASGASPKKLRIPGSNQKDVFYLRTLNDAKAISQRANLSGKAIVLGAGLVSLKGAYNLAKKGLEVVVLVGSQQILSQVLDKKAALIIQNLLEQKGIKFRLGVRPAQILADQRGELEGVLLDDDEVIPGQLVLVGKGVTPNIEFTKGSPIVTHEGILVNEYLETSVTDVYAAGDVAETFDFLTGAYTLNSIWPNATKQGSIAGANMAGAMKSYEGSLAMNSVDFYDLPIIAVGITKPDTSDYSEEVISRPEKNLYRKLVYKDNQLVGYILVGNIRDAGKLMGKLKQGA